MEQKVYFAVEIRYINGRRIESDYLRRNAVPQYLCYFGAAAETQIQEEGRFIIDDDRDRLWFCKEITQPDPSQPGNAMQFFRMGYFAHKIGINEGGKMFHGNADDEDDLREQLCVVE